MKSDDATLFERWLTARDGDAFAELARRHAPVVYDLAARALGDRTAAEDVVQEALLDLALEPTRKPAEVGVPAWLVRFAVCRARNQRSSERSRARRQQIVGLERPEEAMPDDRLECKEELDRALAAAEPDERLVLAMRYLHGWEYPQIAQALSTSEGAVRVRVHRALISIRDRLGVTPNGKRGRAPEKTIAGGMAAMAVIPLPAAKLDAAIRAALDAASVPAGPGATPRAPVAAALRSGAAGVVGVLLLVGAAAWPTLLQDGEGGPADRATASAAIAGDDVGAASTAVVRTGAAASAPATSFRAPRPDDWDGGALARLARGELDLDGVQPAKPVEPVKKDVAAEAPPAPAVAAAVPAPVVPVEERPSSAFRPNERGASAANCDSGSSDGERADAFGGFTRPAAQDAPTERTSASDVAAAVGDEPVAEPKPTPRPRVVARRVTVDALPDADRALVEQAAALVRDVVVPTEGDGTAALPDDPAALRHVKKSVAKALRLKYQAARRAAPPAGPTSARTRARALRLLNILLDIALADGHSAAELRWPAGADVTTALQEVIRVLSTAPATPAAADPADRTPQGQ